VQPDPAHSGQPVWYASTPRVRRRLRRSRKAREGRPIKLATPTIPSARGRSARAHGRPSSTLSPDRHQPRRRNAQVSSKRRAGTRRSRRRRRSARTRRAPACWGRPGDRQGPFSASSARPASARHRAVRARGAARATEQVFGVASQPLDFARIS
jgi:hypothetical protein